MVALLELSEFEVDIEFVVRATVLVGARDEREAGENAISLVGSLGRPFEVQDVAVLDVFPTGRE